MKAIFGKSLEAALNDPVSREKLRSALLGNKARGGQDGVTVTVNGKPRTFKLGEVAPVKG